MDTPNIDHALNTWANTPGNMCLSDAPMQELKALKDRIKALEAKHAAS